MRGDRRAGTGRIAHFAALPGRRLLSDQARKSISEKAHGRSPWHAGLSVNLPPFVLFPRQPNRHWGIEGNNGRRAMDRPLYFLAEFFSKPPGFYVMLAAALLCALVASSTVGTYILSISAIALTGVVLIQNYRDTSAIQAKLNEIIVALDAARNDVVGLEHGSREEITAELESIEKRAGRTAKSRSGTA
ncbi:MULTISPECIES: low affinity iron permease family protein [unclassified Mesorhizobium]|uniref:low affinity iron permease family protein n=3 Tax=Mesorhizobium TaxID=68287 RepID=UPI0032AF9CB3